MQSRILAGRTRDSRTEQRGRRPQDRRKDAGDFVESIEVELYDKASAFKLLGQYKRLWDPKNRETQPIRVELNFGGGPPESRQIEDQPIDVESEPPAEVDNPTPSAYMEWHIVDPRKSMPTVAQPEGPGGGGEAPDQIS